MGGGAIRHRPAALFGVALLLVSATAGCGDNGKPAATGGSTSSGSSSSSSSHAPATTVSTVPSSSVPPSSSTPAASEPDDDADDLGSWRMMAASPLSPRSSSVTVWTGTEMLVWAGVPSTSDDCGMDVGGGPMCGEPAVFDGAAYDPETDTWRTIANGPIPAGGVPTQVIPQGAWTGSELVVWGGWGSPIAAAYDPATDQWRDLPPGSLSAREQPEVTAWDGRVAVLGGRSPLASGGSESYVDGAVVDPSTGQWESLPDLPADGPTMGLSPIAATEADGRLVVVRLVNGDAFALEPGGAEWRSLGSAKLAGAAQPVGLAAGKWLFAVVGGNARPEVAAAFLDLGAEQWVPTDAPTGITEGYLGAGVGDVVLAMAGRWVDDPAPALALSWNPATGTWAELASPPLAHRIAAAVAPNGEELLVWGGLATSGFGGEGFDDGAALQP